MYREVRDIYDIFFGIRDFPHLKLGIRDLKAKLERDLNITRKQQIMLMRAYCEE